MKQFHFLLQLDIKAAKQSKRDQWDKSSAPSLFLQHVILNRATRKENEQQSKFDNFEHARTEMLTNPEDTRLTKQVCES